MFADVVRDLESHGAAARRSTGKCAHGSRRVRHHEYTYVSDERRACRAQAPSFICESPRRDFPRAEAAMGEAEGREELTVETWCSFPGAGCTTDAEFNGGGYSPATICLARDCSAAWSFGAPWTVKAKWVFPFFTVNTGIRVVCTASSPMPVTGVTSGRLR